MPNSIEIEHPGRSTEYYLRVNKLPDNIYPYGVRLAKHSKNTFGSDEVESARYVSTHRTEQEAVAAMRNRAKSIKKWVEKN